MQIPENVKLLLVEGSEETSSFIIETLSKMEYTKFEVSHVKTLEEASTFNIDNIDIILLDLVLPNSDGIDTFKKLHSYYKECPVVIISKHDELGCQSVREGAQDFLPPQDMLTPGLLVRTIKYAIERQRMENDSLKLKRMYQEIVEKTHAAIYEICFTKDKLTYVNDVLCLLTGYNREELLDMSISNLLTEQSKLLWLKRYQLMLQGKTVSGTVEYEVIVKDGSSRWVLLTSSYKYDDEGNIAGARVIALDISDKIQAQMEAKYKEQLVYDDLERKLTIWRSENFAARQIQEQQLRTADIKIGSMMREVGVGVI